MSARSSTPHGNYRVLIADRGVETKAPSTVSIARERQKDRMVGAPRFELGTSCSRSKRATRLRYAPTILSV